MSGQYAGRLRARSCHGGLEVAELSYQGGQQVARHAHERPLLVMVLAGAMEERVLGRSVHCSPGTVLYHPAGEAHAHRFGRVRSRCLVLQFDAGWLGRLDVESGLLPAGPIARIGEAVTGTGRLLREELRRGDASVPAALDGLALTLLASLARGERRPAERRPRYLDIVIQKLHDDAAADVDLASLAALAGVTPEHLARTFRREQHCTVGEYVRRLRVERARRRLVEDDVSLARLAYDLGFYDQSHFTRVFKAQVGCAPGEYRRQARG